MDGDGDILGMRRRPETVPAAAPETATAAAATAAAAAAARHATGASPMKRQRSAGGGSSARVESEVSHLFMRHGGSNLSGRGKGERNIRYPPSVPRICTRLGACSLVTGSLLLVYPLLKGSGDFPRLAIFV